MFKGKAYSYILVFFQFIFIGLLFLNSHLPNSIFSLIIFIFGIILGAWSVLTMRKSKLSIIPDVSKNASLVKDGPYKFIRHPMYSSVLIACLGMLLSNINLINIVFYILLIFDLYSKISFEEKLLLKSFSNYKEYKLNTKKIIPFVYWLRQLYNIEMSLAEAPGLNEGGHFNFEDFNAVVVNNIAGVYFDQHIGQAGNMQRLEDKVKDQKLNPFDPKTYIIHSVRVPQYRLFLNPNLTEDAQIKSFLFNVLRVKTELKRSSTTQLYQTKEQADEADRLDAEKAQRESESFYAEHADLAKDLLKRFLH